MEPRIETLWQNAGFKPNAQQRDAILHVNGPLFLTAGPGSGKTRVLLWRTLNLVVFHQVAPKDIFLGTFTEKAALQLRNGLSAYLAEATRLTGKTYDLSLMPVGTVHSICRRILADRRFAPGRMRPGYRALADELDQYFRVHDEWRELLAAGGFTKDGNRTINGYILGRSIVSKHSAVAAAISLFNRFSEECLEPDRASRNTHDPTLRRLLRMYAEYRNLEITDLSLLQQEALEHCRASGASKSILRHVIVDEYQDTNHVQEALFFHLAAGHRNLCVVGDDDQALYRFRGSTVENLVEFDKRCRTHLGVRPRAINLGKNYRSRKTIVDFYSDFIQHFDWKKGNGKTGAYRVESKQISAARVDPLPAVVASRPDDPIKVCAEVAALVRKLLKRKKVEDPNQIAFLYPSLKSEQVHRMKRALESEGLEVYAPRAGQFLEVEEATNVFGVFLVLFGAPDLTSPGMTEFFEWVKRARKRGSDIIRADRSLVAFIKDRQDEMAKALRDRAELLSALDERNLDREVSDADVDQLRTVQRLSKRATKYLRGGSLVRLVHARRRIGRPITLKYVVNRVTTLDWGVLDVFYELTGFSEFRRAFRLAEEGQDEGPICNLALISQYLARFQARHSALVSASFLKDGAFVRTFFASYVYALWRRGESEYEDAEDPFPKGRIPFLTIHQAKGLEFPVVVLGNPRKRESVQRVEEIVRPLLDRESEPLDRIGTFDVARLFYVALSRPKNLLVICDYRGRGQFINEPFRTILDDGFPRIGDLDINSVPAIEPTGPDELPRVYSYTGDYLSYRTCPRRYLIYRQYRFVPARGQTMFFGSLVHRTIDDLHNWLRVEAEAGRKVS